MMPGMRDSPTEAYCAWLESLPPTVADDLGLALMRLFPGALLQGTLLTAKPTDGLVARIRRLAATPQQDAGTALALSAVTDFVFVERGDPDQWERSEALLGLLDDVQSELGDDGLGEQGQTWVEENRLRYPLRARQWLKERERWGELKRGPLDPTRVLAALQAAMLPRP